MINATCFTWDPSEKEKGTNLVGIIIITQNFWLENVLEINSDFLIHVGNGILSLTNDAILD